MKSFRVFALAVLLAPVALAQRQTFVANPDASEVKMTLKTPAAARPAMAVATRR